MDFDFDFFKNKTVLVTGHTGFKGSWLCKILSMLGANIIGYSLEAPTEPNLYNLANIDKLVISNIGDIRDFDCLLKVFKKFNPEIVIHLAAQPIVRYSYVEPRYTYETNVMGTVNLLECIRLTNCVKSFLNVTTDKVYENKDIKNYHFKENEPLDGFDPYSNSKSCSELVTHSYKKSFFGDNRVKISTARAGNVIGGGDFSADRIIPDCIRAIINKGSVIVRNPFSTRPYQHVLEPLLIYLIILQKQYNNPDFSGYYNIGPDECDCVDTGTLVTKFCKLRGNELTRINKCDGGPHEANFLGLDNSKIKRVFGWSPIRHIDKALKEIVDWTRVFLKNGDIEKEMEKEIKEFFNFK